MFCVFMSKATFSNSEEVVVSRHIGTGGSDFSKLTVAAVNRVVAQINLRPRKRLGWKTPYEVYAGVSVALMC